MTKRPPKPKCAAYLERGISNSAEFLNALNAVAADVASGRITPKQANAVNARLRSILKMVELQLKFGRSAQQTRAHLEAKGLEFTGKAVPKARTAGGGR
jgi:hypothetical protein